jgi:ribosomal-protein-alanine N-acetyltransferase
VTRADATCEPMRAADLPLVHALAERTFSDPWTEAQFAEELARDYAITCVLRHGETLCGYAVAWRLAGEVEILHIAVEPTRQRSGYGRRLLDAVLAAAPEAVLACLDVRASNAAAIALYASAGFARTGLRRGYYSSTAEDAVLMQRTLTPHAQTETGGPNVATPTAGTPA